MKIDLQFHSTYSDGLETPAELVKIAKEAGIVFCALTDHDNTNGVAEFIEAAKGVDLKTITGIEITSNFHGKVAHVLGYGFDLGSPELAEYSKQLIENRRAAFVEGMPLVNEKLQSEGRELIDIDDAISTIGEFWGKPVFAKYLVQRNIMKDSDEAFQYLKLVKIASRMVDVAGAIKIIHAAGGKAVISHPFAPMLSLYDITSDLDEQEVLIKELVELGIDGIETYQSAHTLEQAERAVQMAKKYKIGMTAGSDWHGPIEKKGEGIKHAAPYYLNRLGDLEVPEEVAQEIIKFLA
jgi:3',5'-nucleoside bisphosphate phosphatase